MHEPNPGSKACVEPEPVRYSALTLLNLCYQDLLPGQPSGVWKSGKEQLAATAQSIITAATRVQTPCILHEKPCLLSSLSLDGRGRPQRKMRIMGKPTNFRPWHITWVSRNGPAPQGLQYSHRCSHGNCVEPSHGAWETDLDNKSRNGCRGKSHVVLPVNQEGESVVVRLCNHEPACIMPVVLDDWKDSRVSVVCCGSQARPSRTGQCMRG